MAKYTSTGHDGPSFSVQVETIDISSWGPKPDPAWRFIDAAGHGHFYSDTLPHYPTLFEITETIHDEDGDWEAHVRWQCLHCGEEITPGERPSFWTSSTPGMKVYRVDGEEVDRDTFIAAWRPWAEARLAEQEAAL